jgi:hypothetical protein
MKILLAALVALVTLDGVITEFLVSNGAAREANPFLQPLVGDIGFMVLKIAGSILCAIILWDVHRRYPRLAMTFTWCGVSAYSAIIIWNTSLMLLV